MRNGDEQDAAAEAAADRAEVEEAFAEAAGTPAATPADEIQDAAAAEAAEEGERAPIGTDSASPPDPWAEAPTPLREAYEAERNAKLALEHKIQSDAGRFSSLNRDVRQLRDKLAAAEGKRITGGDDISLKGFLESDKFKMFETEYGADLAPLVDALKLAANNTEAATATATTTAERIEQDALKATLDRNVETFFKAVPDAKELGANPEFAPWLEKQPAYVRENYLLNHDAMTDPDRAIDVFDRFKRHIDAMKPEDSPRDARRQSQLDAAKGIQSKGPAASSAVPDDVYASFNHAVAQDERARR